MTHGDAVVHRDGVELARYAARRPNRLGHNLADVLQMNMAGYELRVRVRDGDDRLTEIGVGHTGRTPEGASARGIASGGGGT